MAAWKKGATAVALLAAAGWLGFSQMKKITPGPEINNGNNGDEFGGNPEERRAQFTQIAREARITPEQQKKLEELRESGDRREGWTKMQEILTTGQREQMRESFMQRRAERDAKMKSAMGEADFERYQEKRAERFRGGRGPGSGGPGSGAPGPGAPR